MPLSRQPDLFEEGPAGPSARDLRITPQGRAPLSKEQQNFNRLLAEVQKLRDSLAEWREFADGQRQRVGLELLPLLAEMGRARRELILQCADLLDSLGATTIAHKTDRRQLIRLLLELSESHLAESAEDVEIVALHDRYAEQTFAEGQAEEWQRLQHDARDLFGVDLPEEPEGSPLEALLDAARRAEEAERQADATDRASRQRGPRSARARQREEERVAAAEAVAREVSQSVRDVYRKLASALHPDRADQATERDRRHVLMQRVNLAYEASDLLGLLTLQLEVEQIDRDHLATISAARLRHYNQVLRDQTRELKQEIDDIADDFRMVMTDPPRRLTFAAVEQDFARCVVEAQGAIAQFSMTSESLRDPRTRRPWLRDYARESEELARASEELESLLFLEGVGMDDVLARMFAPPDRPRARGRHKAKRGRKRR